MKGTLTNRAVNGVEEIQVRGVIDDDLAKAFVSAFDKVQGKKVKLLVNSIGGSIEAAYSMLGAMATYMRGGGQIETFNEGRADSAASWLTSAGTRGLRNAYSFTGMFLHPPMLEDGTTLDDLKADDPRRKPMQEAFDQLVNIFTSVTSLSSDVIRDLMKKETDLTAVQAKSLGLIDNVLEVENAPVFHNKASRLAIMNAASAIDVKIKKEPKKIRSMKLVNTALGLNEEAKDEVAAKEVGKIVNRNSELELQNKTLLAENAKLKAEKKAVEEAAEEQKNKAVTEYVTDYVGKNPMLVENKEMLVNWAKTDFDTFKKLHPLEKKKVTNQKIDDGAKTEEQKLAEKAEAEEKEAKDFDKMPHADKEAMRRSDVTEYTRLSNLRAKYIFGLK